MPFRMFAQPSRSKGFSLFFSRSLSLGLEGVFLRPRPIALTPLSLHFHASSAKGAHNRLQLGGAECCPRPPPHPLCAPLTPFAGGWLPTVTTSQLGLLPWNTVKYYVVADMVG